MAKKKDTLEKLRSTAFFELMAAASKKQVAEVEKLFAKREIRTYADFLAAVERHSRDVFFEEQDGNLDRAVGKASFVIMMTILGVDDAELAGSLNEAGISHLDHISHLVLTRAMEEYEKETGRTSIEAARPTAQRTYVALTLDMWPDSPAAIADFWLTDQEHYEALYYPVRAGQITVEDLDRVLGDPEAITGLAASMPANPHRNIVFGDRDATLN